MDDTFATTASSRHHASNHVCIRAWCIPVLRLLDVHGPPFDAPTCCIAVFAQAHYACARESTVFELALLPAEVLATQAVGVLSCSLGVSANTETTPCRAIDQLQRQAQLSGSATKQQQCGLTMKIFQAGFRLSVSQSATKLDSGGLYGCQKCTKHAVFFFTSLCSHWQRYAVDFAEIGTPCLDLEFRADPSGASEYTNIDACTDIDENRSAADSNEYISE